MLLHQPRWADFPSSSLGIPFYSDWNLCIVLSEHFLALAIYGSLQLLPKNASRNLQDYGGLGVRIGFCLDMIICSLTNICLLFLLSLLKTVSINKAINAQEVAVKEKHARNILLKLELWKKGC